jgi:hypothetical protein
VSTLGDFMLQHSSCRACWYAKLLAVVAQVGIADKVYCISCLQPLPGSTWWAALCCAVCSGYLAYEHIVKQLLDGDYYAMYSPAVVDNTQVRRTSPCSWHKQHACH